MNKKKCANYIVLAVLTEFLGIYTLSIGQQSNGPKADKNTLQPDVKGKAPALMRPAIDMNALSNYKTASFGLG